ncbi:MAG: hypothetical protein OHK0028_09800 [Deltaproteobacteria bacterium]
MTRRSAGRYRAGLSVVFLSMAPFLCGISTASESDRSVPVLRDGSGSGASVKIHREGDRSTATPCVSATGETIGRITERIAGKIEALQTRIDAAPSPADAGIAGPAEPPCSIETLRRRAAGEKVSRTIVTVPGEITVRNVKGFLKALRASRKDASGAPVVFAFPGALPDGRLGMADRGYAGAD